MARGSYWYREVLPFAAMFLVECGNVGSTTLFKAATTKGMSDSVFVVYSFAVSALVLLPTALIFNRKTTLPSLDVSFAGRVGLLVIIGLSAQMMGYRGIDYASPTLGSALSNLTPACTFVLAIIFRMEKLAFRSSSTQAKIVGTMVLISGAFVVTLYKGPSIIVTLSPSISLSQPLKSLQSTWAIGGLLLSADYLLISLWYIVQAQTVKKYPSEFLIVFLFNLFVTIVAAPICFFTEPNLSAWKIKDKTALASIVYTGVIGSALGTVIHTWGLKIKGPVYVALFRPLAIVIAALMGVIFLGEALYLGSLVGAIVISIGFYVVMWGKANEEMVEDFEVRTSVESPISPENAPLLQAYKSEEEK